ncbi:universal stress protein [Bizionia argentinensis JUB59]|uniref:Universal stress protein n=1 Tax=Bizionia argentinensis JUB59 TaxID=1046627 RepID=G2EC82_9FLAO|nr:universal stress protein [Bizionia argentinensis]EGV43965.1 universal stress protein [Bizionia argentinensis JUB59]
MKKIIVPIDFSEYSEYALETAAILAKNNDAEILALHMLELSDAVLSRSDKNAQMETVFLFELAKKKFSEFLDKPYLEGVKITPIVKHYKVFSEVNDVAKEHSVDLIIMGSQGTSGFKEYFVGSNTEKVVRYSDTPVLVIKHNPILTEFDTVIFASDFSEEAVVAYRDAKKMCAGLKADMHLIYINLPGEKFRNTAEMEGKVVSFLKQADGDLEGLSKVSYVSDYTVEQGISNFANLIGADLIAMATHGRKGLAHFFEGSISEDVANHSTLPVMTFKI